MFCPSCGSEYREGFSRCVDCEVALVEAPPSPVTHPDPGDVVTVFATGDPVALLTAKSLLEEAGIPCFTRGEGTQDLFGMGRLGTGFSLIAGPMEIRVGARRAREAEDLLDEADLETGDAEIEGEPPEEDDAEEEEEES
ncbi:MAG TPA: DUF2007 domain-containing protein [Thermoanaerobaculia bacterium]|jgi:hypothetical protein|nr:DUF2007 domain-containing protein [Thermoanaerobaculia bacterium]